MDSLERTMMTIGCRDSEIIPKVPDAGRIFDTPDGPVQIMHNGLRVVAGGYHGNWMAHVIRALRGHHEPQEELLFDAILRLARHGTVIVELGSFWAYYTLWYLKEIPGSRAICVEPDDLNRRLGMTNARLNGLDRSIMFHNAWVGEAAQSRTSLAESLNKQVALPSFDMNGIVSLCENSPIELLHMDVQGAELSFIESMGNAVSHGIVRFLVVSTHHSSISGSRTTHRDCLESIIAHGGRILAEHDVQESFSGDGLIVATFLQQDRHVRLPPISRNVAQHSLFPES